MNIETDDIQNRISRIEGLVEKEKDRGFWENISIRASLLALLISISTGGVTLYDRFFERPRSEVRTILNAISDALIQEQRIQQAGPLGSPVSSGIIGQRLLPLLEESDEAYQHYPEEFTFADRIMLADISSGFGRIERSLFYLDEAEELPLDRDQKSATQFARAIQLTAPGEFEDWEASEELFEEVASTNQGLDTPMAPVHYMRATLALTANYLERNDCKAAENKARSFRQTLADSRFDSTMIHEFQVELEDLGENINHECDVSQLMSQMH